MLRVNMGKVLFAIFLALAFFVSPSNSFAQEEIEDSSSSAKLPKVEYTLPYPGLLPDSPFYFLKTIRDRVVGFLISDPMKKAEFNLLQADKRLAAGIYLSKKRNFSLSESTISKGENYFEQGISNAMQAKQEGIDTGIFLRRLSNAAVVHMATVEELESKAPKEFKSGIRNLLERVEKNKSRVDLLLPE